MATDPFGLQPYLHEHIPLSKHLGIRVEGATLDSVRLGAPLEPNLNHRQTAFGGSISAVAILAAWSLLWCRLRGHAEGHNIVIQASAMEFLAPVTSDFSATCSVPPAEAWHRFVRSFERRGRARIELDVAVHANDAHAATFTGRFVAIRSGTAPVLRKGKDAPPPRRPT